ncbi:MAG: signal peptide peptidase SppA, partial [Proteobacteria bacterium]|nr:signal peptide peptidase SppA [Pseudomonadota bacterium]
LADKPFARWMKEVRDDDAVKAVVLRIDSPGGSGMASDMMWHEVKLTQAAGKKVVVSMGDLAASGGYFIAAPSDWIVAQPSTLTGSIGVFGGKLNLAGTYEKIGLTQALFKRGEQADLLSGSHPFSEEGRATMQAFLDDFYRVFVGKVMEGRGMTYDEVHAVAQGRVWTGEQALERKLVDELGGLDVALAKAAEFCELDEYGIVRLPRPKTFVELLMEDLAEVKAQQVKIQQVELNLGLPIDADALAELLLLQRILEDGPAAIVPGHLTIE